MEAGVILASLSATTVAVYTPDGAAMVKTTAETIRMRQGATARASSPTMVGACKLQKRGGYTGNIYRWLNNGTLCTWAIVFKNT